MEDEKIKDLRGKSAEEIVEAYFEITKDMQKAELIWQETGNMEDAVNLYRAYEEQEKNKELTK